MKIPIFIITKDRVTCLKESIESYYLHINDEFEIVIHDNNSSFEGMLNYLAELKDNGIKVYKNTNVYKGTKKNRITQELNSVKKSIEDYLKNNKTDFYIVTDPDIAIDGITSNILEFYSYILNTTDYNCVGPSLRIDNIPDYYPLKYRAIKHETKFWTRPKFEIEFKNNVYKYIEAKVDTTFAMYRSSKPFRRLMGNCIRTLHPYIARHLDWYIDPENLQPDQKFYMNIDDNIITHWCGKIFKHALKK